MKKIKILMINDKSSHNEDNNMMNIDNKFNELLSIGNNSNISTERELKNIYINNWLICCFNCSSRKKNINKALLEEGYKIVTKKWKKILKQKQKTLVCLISVNMT